MAGLSSLQLELVLSFPLNSTQLPLILQVRIVPEPHPSIIVGSHLQFDGLVFGNK